MTEKKETRSTKQPTSSAKTFSKEALVEYFKGKDSLIAKVILPDKPQTLPQAQKLIESWKKEELK